MEFGVQTESTPATTQERRAYPVRTARPWIGSAAAVLLCAIGLAHLFYHASYTLDDAYISFRYARNLARGMGLVYNPGEYVKGYSNTLFTLLMVVPELFGSNPIWLARSVGALAFCALCWVGYRFYRDDPQAGTRDYGLWLLLFLALSTAIAVHCITGLETGLYAALLFAAALSRLREQRCGGAPWSALLFAMVVLSRPEGILAFAAMAAQDVVVRIRSRRLSAFDALWYLVPVLAYVGELGVSKLYYGDALPQTYYAKTRTIRGAGDAIKLLRDGLRKQFSSSSYLGRGLQGTGWGFVGLGVAGLALFPRARRVQNLAFASIVLAQITFMATAGSDWAPVFRFGVPMLPFLFVLLVEAIGFVASFARGQARVVGWLLALLATAAAVPVNLAASRDVQAKKYVDGEGLMREGDMLRKLAPPGITLSSYDIGGQGYRAGGFDILDAAGLTLRETAKCRGNGTPRCRRFVALVRPELVRRHPSLTKDAYVASAARKTEPYLELEAGRYLLQRSLVLVDEAPSWTLGAELRDAGTGLAIVARDVAPVLAAGQETTATLYWRRDPSSVHELGARRLEWIGGAGRLAARESDVLWSVSNPQAWSREELFADFVLLRAPALPGRYQLVVTADGGQALRVAAVEVIDGSVVQSRAKALVDQAQSAVSSAGEDAAIALLARAVQLDSSAKARDAYQRAVVRRAQRLREQANGLLGFDRSKALRLLQQAKVQLHRAYWESGSASSQLRREIDQNASLCKRIVDQDAKMAR
jgi:arabinofuranosyltransferase